MAVPMLTIYTNDKSAALCKHSSFTAATPSVTGSRTRKIPWVFALPPVDWTWVYLPETQQARWVSGRPGVGKAQQFNGVSAKSLGFH
jgi:hypothetical protein